MSNNPCTIFPVNSATRPSPHGGFAPRLGETLLTLSTLLLPGIGSTAIADEPAQVKAPVSGVRWNTLSRHFSTIAEVRAELNRARANREGEDSLNLWIRRVAA